MSQHDNGRRTPDHQFASQQGTDWRHEESNARQDPSHRSRYGSQYGHPDDGNSGRRESQRGGHQQEQFDSGREQQGDRWGRDDARDMQGSGGFRDDGGRADIDAHRDDAYGTIRGRNEAWRSGQREGGRDPSHASQSYGPGGSLGEGDYGEGRWGSDRDRGRDWRGEGGPMGSGSRPGYWDDRPRDWRVGSAQEHYGDGGRQSDWIGGRNGQSFHDPDYHQWRGEQMQALDRDYDEWRQHRYQRFADDFNSWRGSRQNAGKADASAQSDATTHVASSVTGAQLDADAGRDTGAAEATTKSSTPATGTRDAARK